MHGALVAAAVVVALLGVGAGPATVEAATHSARGTGTTIVASFSFEARREDGRVSGRVTVETGALAGTLRARSSASRCGGSERRWRASSTSRSRALRTS